MFKRERVLELENQSQMTRNNNSIQAFWSNCLRDLSWEFCICMWCVLFCICNVSHFRRYHQLRQELFTFGTMHIFWSRAASFKFISCCRTCPLVSKLHLLLRISSSSGWMSKLGPRDHCREAAASSNRPGNHYFMERIMILEEKAPGRMLIMISQSSLLNHLWRRASTEILWRRTRQVPSQLAG